MIMVITISHAPFICKFLLRIYTSMFVLFCLLPCITLCKLVKYQYVVQTSIHVLMVFFNRVIIPNMMNLTP